MNKNHDYISWSYIVCDILYVVAGIIKCIWVFNNFY